MKKKGKDDAYLNVILFQGFVLLLVSILFGLTSFQLDKSLEENRILKMSVCEENNFVDLSNNLEDIVLPSDDLIDDLPSGLIIKGVLS